MSAATIAAQSLSSEHHGQTLVYTDRSKTRRGVLVQVEHMTDHAVASVRTTTGERPIVLPYGRPVTIEP